MFRPGCTHRRAARGAAGRPPTPPPPQPRLAHADAAAAASAPGLTSPAGHTPKLSHSSGVTYWAAALKTMGA